MTYIYLTTAITTAISPHPVPQTMKTTSSVSCVSSVFISLVVYSHDYNRRLVVRSVLQAVGNWSNAIVKPSLKPPWHLYEFIARLVMKFVVVVMKLVVKCSLCVRNLCGNACIVVERILKCSKLCSALSRIQFSQTIRELFVNYTQTCREIIVRTADNSRYCVSWYIVLHLEGFLCDFYAPTIWLQFMLGHGLRCKKNLGRHSESCKYFFLPYLYAWTLRKLDNFFYLHNISI